MINYDFVVTNRVKSTKNNDAVKLKLVTERVAVLDDDITLDTELSKLGVYDDDIGHAIELLESLPYGAKHVYVYGSSGRILIEQS